MARCEVITSPGFYSSADLLFYPQVRWFTSDGAAVNRTTLRALQNSPTMEPGWTAREHDML